MTDPNPTPTRAEVERFDIVNVAYDLGEYVKRIEQQEGGRFVRFTDYEALRERAEAAERLVSEAEAQRYKSCAELMNRALEAEAALTAARRAEAAAWNDAIEAAAERVGDLCKFDGRKCDAEAIHALRRAAPTEGEA